MWARIKAFFGGNPPSTLASAATMSLTDSSIVILTGSETITSLVHPSKTAGMVTLIGGASANITLTNTNNPTTAWQMDLGGSNRTLADSDAITLFLMPNGTWLRIDGPTDN